MVEVVDVDDVFGLGKFYGVLLDFGDGSIHKEAWLGVWSEKR